MKNKTILMVSALLFLYALSGCGASEIRTMPDLHAIAYPEDYPTTQDEYGADAYAGALNHADSQYYIAHDFYHAKSGGSLHILSGNGSFPEQGPVVVTCTYLHVSHLVSNLFKASIGLLE